MCEGGGLLLQYCRASLWVGRRCRHLSRWHTPFAHTILGVPPAGASELCAFTHAHTHQHVCPDLTWTASTSFSPPPGSMASQQRSKSQAWEPVNMLIVPSNPH